MSLGRTLKNFFKRLPGFRSVDRYLCYRYTGWYVPERFPRGHFYSPLPGYRETADRRETLFDPQAGLGAEHDPALNLEGQIELMQQLASFRDGFDWPEKPAESLLYYKNQRFFSGGDAWMLYALMRQFRPARMVEAGSGFSSALMLDVSRRFLDSGVQLTFVEPFPERLNKLLDSGVPGSCTVMECPLQDVPMETFESLDAGDILFVDSSHVSKIGSDVNRLVFEILPRLAPGVIVHFHDVFWPFEYPEDWVMDGRGWNEAYLLRALLQYQDTFQVLFWASHLAARAGQQLANLLPEVAADPGGSLWLRKTR